MIAARLMVGRGPLKPEIEVRALGREPMTYLYLESNQQEGK